VPHAGTEEQLNGLLLKSKCTEIKAKKNKQFDRSAIINFLLKLENKIIQDQTRKISVRIGTRPDRDHDHGALPSRRPKLRLPSREKRPLRDPALLLPAMDAFVTDGPAVPVTFTKEP